MLFAEDIEHSFKPPNATFYAVLFKKFGFICSFFIKFNNKIEKWNMSLQTRMIFRPLLSNLCLPITKVKFRDSVFYAEGAI